MVTNQEMPYEGQRAPMRWIWPSLALVALIVGAQVWLLGGAQRDSSHADRRWAINNLRQIALALNTYALNEGHLPVAVVTDKAGRPLYSWRVLILPYMEEDKLYDQFHLDEPWDSPHNRTLLDYMPKTYALPGDPDAREYRTRYRVFTGEAAAFPPHGPWKGNTAPTGRIPQDFPDGMSKTLLVVEAAESVPWTKPDELIYEPDQSSWQARSLLPDRRFDVAFGSASVTSVPYDISESTLRALITRNGGENVDDSGLFYVQPRTIPVTPSSRP